MNERRTAKNGGFSLVELLVAMAIMAVLAAAAVTGIGMLSGARMNQCVEKLDSALNEAWVSTMSRGSGGFLLSRDAEGDYFVQIGTGEKQKVAEAAVSISYVDSVSGLEHPVTPEAPLEIHYAADSGAFLPLSGEAEVYCERITVKMGEKHSASIRLVRDTGRHYVE